MIRKVFVYSNQTPEMAEQTINKALEQYQNEKTDVCYELIIESSINIAGHSDVRYTVLIEISDVEFID